jgi:large subunit ribosomal protein L6
MTAVVQEKKMSRIGKKPIALPAGVSYAVEGNTVVVKGPKGSVSNHLPAGVELATEDGHLIVKRESDNKAAVHGLARALLNNAVTGVTTGGRAEGQGHRGLLAGFFSPHRVSAADRRGSGN